jgi:hypothetical protein
MGIDHVPMEDRATRRATLYEYMLGKIASAGQNGQFRTPRHIIRLMVEKAGQLCLAALFFRQRQHTRMPLFVLGMSIAEPSAAFCAMHGRGTIVVDVNVRFFGFSISQR